MSQRRLVLDGVPRVGFYDGSANCPEDITFPSCVAAAVEYIEGGHPRTVLADKGRTWYRNDYEMELVAASGMAFGLRWREGWYQDSADMMFIADPSEVMQRTFAATGYAFRGVDKTGAADDEARFRQEIKQSLAAGRPVIAFGVIGPPEPCLITGYDEGGDVLIGWNFFQNMPPFNAGTEFEPSGYFRRRDWFPGTWALTLLGERADRAPAPERYRETLRWGIAVARTPRINRHATGFAAYDAWAKQVLTDTDFLTDDERVLQSRHEIHNSAVGLVAECRWDGSEVLKAMAEEMPASRADLLAAADCYVREHDLMWKVWGLVGGNGHPDAFRKFADPAVRKQIAPLILEAREQDEQAVKHLEQALAR